MGEWEEAMFSGFPGKMNKCYCLLAKENPYTKITRKTWLYSYWNKYKEIKLGQRIHLDLNR